MSSYSLFGHHPGPSWSTTNSGHLVYASRLELECLWRAHFDPNVVRIAARPLQAPVTAVGCRR